MRTYVIGFPVWGAAYIDVFFNVSMPSLLASGNIPWLLQTERVIVVVTTSAQDVPVIENDPRLAALRRVVDVEILEIPIYPEKFPTFANAHETIFRTYHHPTTVFTMMACDLLVSDGFFRAIKRRIDEGCDAVVGFALRGNQEALNQEIEAFRTEDGVITIPPRTLATLILRHLHLLSRRQIWGEPSEPIIHHSVAIWGDARTHLLSRTFHPCPVAFTNLETPPKVRKALDSSLLDDSYPTADRFHYVTDSDELCFVGLTPIDEEEMTESHETSEQRVRAAAAWCAHHPSRFMFDFARQPMWIRARDARPEEDAILEIESRAILERIAESVPQVDGWISDRQAELVGRIELALRTESQIALWGLGYDFRRVCSTHPQLVTRISDGYVRLFDRNRAGTQIFGRAVEPPGDPLYAGTLCIMPLDPGTQGEMFRDATTLFPEVKTRLCL